MDGHKWSGVLYLVKNSMFGSLFSYYDNKVFIVRGYPKIRYAESSRVLDKYCWAEWKHDGTNLVLFTFPDGSLEGKTREVPNIFGRIGYRGREYDNLLLNTGYLEAIHRLCKLGYSICGELFGYLNEGDFIRYTTPIDFEVFNIVDISTFAYLPLEDARRLCQQFELKHVKVLWNGILNTKGISKLEYEAKALVKVDGSEGFVCKTWSKDINDIHMCKVKCQEIKELCWALSPKQAVPRELVRKAVRKAWENQKNLESMDAIIDYVKEELVEDVNILRETMKEKSKDKMDLIPKPDEMISKSLDRIKREINIIFTAEANYDKSLFGFFESLEKEGIEVSLENKQKVLSISATKFIGISPSVLFNSFMMYIKKDK